METERVTEFSMSQLDLRPRKRQRLGWDVVATPPKAQLGLFCGQEIGNLQSFTPSSRAPSDNINSNILKRVDCAALQFWVGSVTDDASCAALGALLMQVSPAEVIFDSQGLSKEAQKALNKYSLIALGALLMQVSPAEVIFDSQGLSKEAQKALNKYSLIGKRSALVIS